MRTLFEEIFEYQHEFNERLIAELKKSLNQLPEKTYPLFCHVLNAHQIWNARILGQETFGVHEVYEIDACLGINKDNYQSTLMILKEKDLNETLIYHNSKGTAFQNKISDILFHVANHSTHHKGQIIADFRSSGLEPLVTDYIFYKR